MYYESMSFIDTICYLLYICITIPTESSWFFATLSVCVIHNCYEFLGLEISARATVWSSVRGSSP